MYEMEDGRRLEIDKERNEEIRGILQTLLVDAIMFIVQK